MRVSGSQTKRAISQAKHAIGLKLGGRLELIKYTLNLIFIKKSHMAGFPIDGHIYALCKHLHVVVLEGNNIMAPLTLHFHYTLSVQYHYYKVVSKWPDKFSQRVNIF